MKKNTLFILLMISGFGFSQSKSTGNMNLLLPSGNASGIIANFTLDNNTSKVTLILIGPADKWFGLGIGVNQGFGMASGDCLVYSEPTALKLTDRNFGGTFQPPLDASQDWTIVSNTVNGLVRTLNLTRNLTNADSNDFQMPYATTNSISVAGPRPPGITTAVAPHGGTSNVGYATAQFTTLGVEDFSLNATSIFPNPSNGSFNIQTKTNLDKINIYSQTGQFVKTIDVADKSDKVEVNVKGLSAGIYLIELKNATEKSWKKVVVE